MSSTSHPGPAMPDRLRKFLFLADLTDSELAALAGLIKTRSFRKGELILREEDTAHFMYLIFSGKVKVVQTSPEGKEQILAIHKRGEFFGEMALLDGRTSPAAVVALEESEVGLITRADFEREFLGHGKIVRRLMAILCTRLRDAWLMLKVLSFADAEERVRAVLRHLSTIHGVRDDRGIILTIKLTHREIADYTSLSRETVTRVLNKFTDNGKIAVLDEKKLLLFNTFFL